MRKENQGVKDTKCSTESEHKSVNAYGQNETDKYSISEQDQETTQQKVYVKYKDVEQLEPGHQAYGRSHWPYC